MHLQWLPHDVRSAVTVRRLPGSEAFFRLRLARVYVDQRQYVKAIYYGEEYRGMPKHWSDFSTDATYAHLWLAIAYHAIGDQAKFQRHARTVDASKVPERVSKDIANSFRRAGIRC